MHPIAPLGDRNIRMVADAVAGTRASASPARAVARNIAPRVRSRDNRGRGCRRAMDETYHEGSRRLQDRFDTRRLADRLDDRFVSRPVIDEDDRAFIERMDMFFLATADPD